MDLLPDAVSPAAFVAAVLITLLGGFVKGAVGFALPLIMVSGMGIFLPPATVVGAVILPVVLANALQAVRSGPAAALEAVRDFRVFLALACVMILISAQFLTRLPPGVIFVVLGAPVVVLCVVQLAGLRMVIPPRRRPAFGVVAGLTAGTIGGLAGTWGPPTVLYLLAIDTPKARQMVIQGVIYGTGSVALLVGHLRSGVLDAEMAPMSAALIVPAYAGIWLGLRLGDRLDQEQFRRVTLIVLAVAGANLVRRGLMG